MLSIALSAIVVGTVARSLPPADFGFWLALVSLTNLVASLDFGIGNATRNRLANLVATSADSDAGRIFAAALLLAGGLAALLMVISGIGLTVLHATNNLGWSSTQGAAALTTLVLLGAFQVGSVGRLSLFAYGEAGWVSLLEVIRWGSLTLVVILLYLFGGGLYLMTLAYFGALAASTLASIPIARRHRGWRAAPELSVVRNEIRVNIRSGVEFAVLQIMAAALYQTDVLIGAQFGSLPAVAKFALVQRLFLIPLSLHFAAIIPFWDRASRDGATGMGSRAALTGLRLSAASVAGAGLFSMFVIAFGNSILNIFSGYMIDDVWLFVGLGCWLVISVVAVTCSTILSGLGYLKIQIIGMAVALGMKTLLTLTALSSQGMAVLPWVAALSILPVAMVNMYQLIVIVKPPPEGHTP